MVQFIHTADWQLGRTFASLPEHVAGVLAKARLDAVRTIAGLAQHHQVDAVLVAGDVFDALDARAETVLAALAAMEGFTGPWFLLPGNHDPAVPGGVWTRLRSLGAPANVMAATEPAPIPLLDGRAVILPAPLTARHTDVDFSRWMDTCATAAGMVRVGLAHGSVRERLPDGVYSTNPIAVDRAARARLDYLALGDWHGTREIDARTWYAGTPEPDRAKDNGAGNALLVDIDGPGARPRVTVLATARHRWWKVGLDLTAADPDGAAALLDRAAEGIARDGSAIVTLALEGLASLTVRERVEVAVERWRGALCHLDIEEAGLVTEPGADELAALAAVPLLGEVAEALASRRAGGAQGEAAVAALALRLLWRAHHRSVAAP
jgi:DNA repair exonuclease SbcCD nuclease subunit